MARTVDVAIVGGGISGMTAALTAARRGWKTIVLTGGVPGGQLISIDKVEGVPGFPDGIPGYDLAPMAQEQADAAGAELMMASCQAIEAAGDRWVLKSDEDDVSARAVVFATGASFAKLGLHGEKQFAGKGVSDCASCDGPLLRDKVAVVVGGGDSALQEALTLADHAAKVFILERTASLTGQAIYQERIRANKKIEVRAKSTVVGIGGGEAVSHVRVKDLATGGEADLSTSAVFPFIGLVPNSDLGRGLLPLDASGRVIVDSAMRTSARGVCAVGNVRRHSSHRAAGAMGDGTVAAMSIDRYLKSGEWRDTDDIQLPRIH
jgi:thioredoxin reductase (NADPH)